MPVKSTTPSRRRHAARALALRNNAPQISAATKHVSRRELARLGSIAAARRNLLYRAVLETARLGSKILSPMILRPHREEACTIARLKARRGVTSPRASIRAICQTRKLTPNRAPLIIGNQADRPPTSRCLGTLHSPASGCA